MARNWSVSTCMNGRMKNARAFSESQFKEGYNICVSRFKDIKREGCLIMTTLSKWWYTEYAEEIYEALREKENKRMPFHQQSPQFKYRHFLVSWLRAISEEMNLSNTTVHLAVYLLDMFMDNHGIIEERLNLVTLVCLFLAAKFEERDLNVPKISELNARVGNHYPTTDFIMLEFMVLHFMQWSLVIPTAAHFAEYFVAFATSPSDMDCSPQCATYQQLKDAAQQSVRDFLDMSLQEVLLIPLKPSLVAASCIAAARQYLQLYPEWTTELQNITYYQFKDLQPCVNLLISKFGVQSRNKLKRKETESPDHGYVTADSLPTSPIILSSRKVRKCTHKRQLSF